MRYESNSGGSPGMGMSMETDSMEYAVSESIDPAARTAAEAPNREMNLRLDMFMLLSVGSFAGRELPLPDRSGPRGAILLSESIG